MSRSAKAMLLSALLFPGAGHFYLKHYPRAIALLLVSFIALWTLVSNILIKAKSILSQIQSQDLNLDMGQITEISATAAELSNDLTTSIALYTLLICWILAIIDCYRLGKLLTPED